MLTLVKNFFCEKFQKPANEKYFILWMSWSLFHIKIWSNHFKKRFFLIISKNDFFIFYIIKAVFGLSQLNDIPQ